MSTREVPLAAPPRLSAVERLLHAGRGALAGTWGGILVAVILVAATWLNDGLLGWALQGSANIVLMLALGGALGRWLLVAEDRPRMYRAGFILWGAAGAAVGAVGGMLHGLKSGTDGALFGAVFGSLLGAIGGSVRPASSPLLPTLGYTALVTLLGTTLGSFAGAGVGATFSGARGPGVILVGMVAGAMAGIAGWWIPTQDHGRNPQEAGSQEH